MSPLPVHQRSPYGESCPSPEPSFTHTPWSPSKTRPSRFHSHSSLGERRFTSRAPSSISQSPGKWTPLQAPQRVCYGEGCPSSFLLTWCMALIVGSNYGRVIGWSRRPLPDNTQHSEGKNIHVPGGFQTFNLSKVASADWRLRPGGNWNRLHDI